MAVIGIDEGASKTAGILLAEGRIEGRVRLRTDTSSSQAVLAGLLAACSHLMDEAASRRIEVSGIGVGVAGFIDFEAGVVTDAPNQPLHDFPIRDLLAREVGKPVCVDNDANLAALAEARLGAGKDSRYLIHLTLGTGIGGGIALDGHLYRGALGSAGEFGHIIIVEGGPQCNSGHHGCLEALASGTALYRRVEELAAGGVESAMTEDFLKNPESFTAGDICRHADSNDSFAIDILAEAGKHLGSGIATLVNIFNPDVVTLSGGLLECFHYMEGEMRRAYEENAIPISRRHARILTTALGDDGGQWGAALLALEGA